MYVLLVGSNGAPETNEDTMSTTNPTYTHLISDERWGETCLIDDMESFVRDMEASMFGAQEAAQKLAEIHDSLQPGEICEETEESIREGWRNELRDALQEVAPVTLADGRQGWMTSREAVYADRGNGTAEGVGDWIYLRESELSTVCEHLAGQSLVHNDRGNGCGGPGYEYATDVSNEIDDEDRDDETLTQVTESEDREAWDLSREAFRALDLDPSTVSRVWVGERNDGDNGRQMIYAA
jgi:hypothetical protein